MKGALAGGEHALLQMAMATHAGTTTEEFESIVADWTATAKHPKTGRLYTEMVYQPMLELLAYLRASGFKTFIVSGGEREWAYDRESHIGRLDKGLDEARARGWTVVDMRTDWKQIYPLRPER